MSSAATSEREIEYNSGPRESAAQLVLHVCDRPLRVDPKLRAQVLRTRVLRRVGPLPLHRAGRLARQDRPQVADGAVRGGCGRGEGRQRKANGG